MYLNVASPDPSALELELLYKSNEIRGGFGTRGDGVVSQEGLRAWIRAVGSGVATRLGTGPADVTEGTLSGYVALAGPGGTEGALGTCSATDHRFTLRANR